MNNSGNILIVDDEEFIQLNLKNILSEENFNIFVENNGKSALSIIEQEQIDLAFLDLNLPDMHGLEVLKRIKQVQPEMLVIIMTGYASVESAVDAIKLGAYDYIKKPFKADAIKLITKLGFDALNLKRKVKQLEDERHKGKTLDSILGNSEAINEVKEQIKEYAKYETETVLITGESGSGKELAGMAIHYLSPRADKEFVEINCASIPDNLLESELFGYEKGAFTDASKAKEGLFEKANGGTLFLDEIGEMSLPLQAKLLRVLENKRFRRLGSTKDKEVNVRVIAATNKDLIKAIEAGEFRQDLYFRLDVLRISMPPLRKRGNDVELLANYFLHYFATKFGKNIQGFHQSALDTMKRYDWPGNVRELRNIVERACILAKSESIHSHDLSIGNSTNKSSGEERLEEELHRKSFEEIIETVEIKLLGKAFDLAQGNISEAARILKIPRETLRYKIKKYNLQIGEN